uniref:Uncharacterized protein n=1 Tax=Anguilla anguilla TaxID=7936 RepID=A0A0E9PZ36_ANGAN
MSHFFNLVRAVEINGTSFTGTKTIGDQAAAVSKWRPRGQMCARTKATDDRLTE